MYGRIIIRPNMTEFSNFIILDHYSKYFAVHKSETAYQSESALEREFIQDLIDQGYDYLSDLTTAMLANVRVQLQPLNDMIFTDDEWTRFVKEYLDKPSDNLVDKTRKIHDDYIYDFVFDDGHIQNIYLVDKKQVARNKVQVISQFEQTGKARRGYIEVVNELNQRFPDPNEIVRESDKKDFVKLFGEYLRVENILQNYDEFTHLKALQDIDLDDKAAVEAFKETYFVTDEDIAVMQSIKTLPERTVQDYRSTYNDIRYWLRRERQGNAADESTIDWDDVVFEVDLLKSQEINLDYILELIFEHNKKTKDKAALIDEMRRIIRASIGNRAKETLIVDFINETDLDTIPDKASIIDSFFTYAQGRQKREAAELITEENLNEAAAKRYIKTSLKRNYASENGTELNALLPRMSPLNPQYLTKKQSVFQKIALFVERFKGIGGEV
ncbi:MAG: type I restriction endonuclease [Bacteroidota bacterium]